MFYIYKADFSLLILFVFLLGKNYGFFETLSVLSSQPILKSLSRLMFRGYQSHGCFHITCISSPSFDNCPRLQTAWAVVDQELDMGASNLFIILSNLSKYIGYNYLEYDVNILS